jgi:type I restriction-modification system DNA methylase subunit/restriction endonuclease S subunit
MSKYTCSLCQKVFAQKIDFTRHTNKKTPCISIAQIQEIQKADTGIESYDEKVSQISRILYSCHNILRDREGITGEKALRNITNIVVLKSLGKYLEDEDHMGLLTYPYDFSDSGFSEEQRQTILSYVYFDNLLKMKEDNIKNNIGVFWDIVLSQNPFTSKIFQKGMGFDIGSSSTFSALFSKINELEITDQTAELIGDAYEIFIKDVMKGKTLGQFFTPPVVRKKLVKILHPQIRPDGSIPTCCDPTAGTCGLLIRYLYSLQNDAKSRNISIDWDEHPNVVYGREIDVETSKLGVSNMLVSFGRIFDGLTSGDSIRKPIVEKFDYVTANPPFGIKGLKYDEIHHDYKNEYTPIKTDNAVSLFLQAIICMLNVGGTASVVLPDGQDLFSKSGAYVLVREYLMKTCDLKGVYYLPAGVFVSTPIKTCIFHFVKRREGRDVLASVDELPEQTDGKKKRAKKPKNGSIFCTNTHQTSTVRFYDHIPSNNAREDGTDTLFAEVSIEDIAANSYSLNYTEYIKDTDTEEQDVDNEGDGVVVKTLGEVCEFQNGSQLDKKDMVVGNIPIYGGGVKIVGFHNSYNRNGNETIVCGTGNPGYVNYSYGKPFWASQCFTLKSKNTNNLLDKYLYYYSKIVLENEFMSKQKGTAQKFIRFNQVIDIKIPIPPVKRQQEIVEYLDFIQNSNKTTESRITELKKFNAYRLKHQQMFGENVVKTLGEIFNCKMGKYNSNDMDGKGDIPFYSCKSNNPVGVHSEHSFEFPEYLLLVSAGGSRHNMVGDSVGLGKSYYVTGKTACRANVCALIPKNKDNIKYINYYLNINRNDTNKKAHFTTNLGIISLDDIKSIKIPIPPLERQQEIVEYCERNDAIIRELEQEIAQTKQLTATFMTEAIRCTTITELDNATEPDVENVSETLESDNDDEPEDQELTNEFISVNSST